MKRNTDSLLNAETIECMFMSSHQTVGQNHNIKTANKSFGTMATLRYFGMTINKKHSQTN
jgi:hypothetical protein